MDSQAIAVDDGVLDRLLSTAIDGFGLSVEAQWREEARYVLGVLAQSARVILAADLGDRAEPATVFHA